LNENPTPRSKVTKFSTFFKPFIQKKVLDAYRASPLISTHKRIPLQQEAQAFLNHVKWSQDRFINTYVKVFDAMVENTLEKNMRLSNDLEIRICSMATLSWSPDSKHRYRDWEKIVTAITIETAIIPIYRAPLLDKCPISQILRDELHTFFFSITPMWNQITKQDNTTTLVSSKRWIFADNIYPSNPSDSNNNTQDVPLVPDIPAAPTAPNATVSPQAPVDSSASNISVVPTLATVIPPDDHAVLRSKFNAIKSTKSGPKKKAPRKKAPVSEPVDSQTSDSAPEQSISRTAKKAASSSTAVDKRSLTKSDDIQSLLSLLASIQNHKLLKCTDLDAPSGSTESIVSFAASIIGHVRILPRLL
jgi:hypothetical protein